jgi:hypothetical protein
VERGVEALVLFGAVFELFVLNLTLFNFWLVF